MKFQYQFEVDPDSILVLPLLALDPIKCEDCDLLHGLLISTGFLWFTARFQFGDGPLDLPGDLQ